MHPALAVERHDSSSVAVIDGDRVVTYGELASLVRAARADLARRGVGRTTAVAVVAGNDVEFVVAVLAVLGVGGVVAPLLPTSPLPEIDRKLDLVDPRLILAGGAGSWLAERVDDSLAPVALIDLDVLAASDSEPPPVVDPGPDDLAFAIPTSGVTSDPKAVMLTHANLEWSQRAVTEHPSGVTADDVLLAALPFSHIFGLNVVMLSALRAGATLVLQARFDEAETLRLCAEHKVTLVAGAPPMWSRIATAPGPDAALATVRRATSGAAALPEATYWAIKERFGLDLGEGYGLTETSSLVSWSMGHETRPGSVGKPIDGLDVVIVDPDGEPVSPGDVGEIVVRGPGVFSGYLGSPEVTDTVLSTDGWFWTGDMGLLDPDGYLHLVDRAKDIIIVSGFNVFPGEVEAVLGEHPEVGGAVVVGEQDARTGETVVAYLTAAENGSGNGHLDPDALALYARERLSEYKCPTRYRIVDELPVAPTGKVIRRKLRS